MATKSKNTATIALPSLEAVQVKAKLAYAKGAVAFGEIKGFTKGNIEAVVESGKILGSGLRDIGTVYAAEGRGAVQTANADLKALTSVKSAGELVELNAKLLGRNLDAMFKFGAEQSQAVLKLAKQASLPLTKRLDIATDTIRKVA